MRTLLANFVFIELLNHRFTEHLFKGTVTFEVGVRFICNYYLRAYCLYCLFTFLKMKVKVHKLIMFTLFILF